jgi:hypothetical protein
MSIGGLAMKIALAGTIAAAAFAAISGAAQAEEKSVCQWTGIDWACGDGNIVTRHVAEGAAPNMTIAPIKTLDPARDETAGAAQGRCYWAGNHWNCADRYIYPKSYPWGTAVINGQYQRPMSPSASDVN